MNARQQSQNNGQDESDKCIQRIDSIEKVSQQEAENQRDDNKDEQTAYNTNHDAGHHDPRFLERPSNAT